MGPSVLGLIITHKCNLKCRHCCNDSHPRRTGVVPFEDLARLIEEASGLPGIREVGISGGEPFLLIPLVRRLVQLAGSRGLSSSITTNGFWAKAPARARATLADLRGCGLRSVCISTSPFHQEFLDLDDLKAAARIALEVGLSVTVNFVSTTSAPIGEFREALGELAGRVEVVHMPFIPAGRGATEVGPDELDRRSPAPSGNCRRHFEKLAIDPDGDVYPCCSPGGFTGPLRLGNVRDAPLGAILADARGSRLLAILEAVGPRFFLPFLRAAAIGPPLPERFGDQCHLCNVILSEPTYLPVILGAAEQLFEELAALGSGGGGPAGDALGVLTGPGASG